MSEQAWVRLARAGGAAVVRAAGTDAWAGLRSAMAQWFGRGDEQRQRAELERLDRTAAELARAPEGVGTGTDHARVKRQEEWRSRIERLLEELPEDERQRAAEELSELSRRAAPPHANEAGPGGITVPGPFRVHAEQRAVAAGIVRGDVHVHLPPRRIRSRAERTGTG